MKLFLCFLAISCTLAVNAQNKPYVWKPKNGEVLILRLSDSLPKGITKKPGLQLPIIWQRSNNPSYNEQPRYLGNTAHGPVYALPQDNMPCVKPALKSDAGIRNFRQQDSLLKKPIDPGIYLNRRYWVK